MHSIIPLSRFRPFLATAMALSLTALIHAAPAKEGRFTLGDNETVAFAAPASSDAAVQLTLTLPRSYLPSPAPTEATFALHNSTDYVWWSGPLKARADGTWVIELPPQGAEAVLIADKAVVSFGTGKAAANPLTFIIPRERLVQQLGAVVPRMHDKPFFFTPSDPSETPAAPTASVPRNKAEGYVTKVEHWDSEMQASLYSFDSQLVRARSLWRDLNTAGRLPWKEDTIRQLGALYQQVQSQREELHQIREAARQKARAFVSAWNAAHASDPGYRSLEINFYGGA